MPSFVRTTTTSPPARDDCVAVYLHAGQLFASADACEISMVLGSCVSVCLLDAARRIAGANHYLLPIHVSGSSASPRFGNVAVAELVERVVALGASRKDLVAKVFGGASVLPSVGRGGADSLGWKNVEVARRLLGTAGIPILAEDVGGFRGRRLVFRTDEDAVWIKVL